MSSSKPTTRPGVGVGVVVVRSSSPSTTIYAGVRRGSHGATRLALPGGHLEYGESWESCARREVAEEMGLQELQDVRFGYVTNDIMEMDRKHYVTIFMLARSDETPRNLEPHKCEGWKEFTLDELMGMVGTGGLFVPLENLLKEGPQVLRAYMDQTAEA